MDKVFLKITVDALLGERGVPIDIPSNSLIEMYELAIEFAGKLLSLLPLRQIGAGIDGRLVQQEQNQQPANADKKERDANPK